MGPECKLDEFMKGQLQKQEERQRIYNQRRAQEEIQRMAQAINGLQQGILESEKKLQEGLIPTQVQIQEIDVGMEKLEEVIPGKQMVVEMRRRIDSIKDTIKQRLRNLELDIIEIKEGQIVLKCAQLDPSKYTTERLSQYIEDAIIPVIRSHRLQIVTGQHTFNIHLLPLQDQSSSSSLVEFLQIIKATLSKNFGDTPFTKEILAHIISTLQKSDPTVLSQIKNIGDQLLTELIQPYINQSACHSSQLVVAKMISELEESEHSKVYFKKWVESLLAALRTNPDDEVRILSQVLIRYIYLQKEGKNRLKIWAQSRQLLESLYSYKDGGLVEQIIAPLQKIESSLITKQYKLFISEVDVKVHESIRKLSNLEQLQKSGVSMKVKDAVKAFLKHLEDIKKVFSIFYHISIQSSFEHMGPHSYKELVVQSKVAKEYLPLLISQVLSQITDISIDSNDQLSQILDQLQQIPAIFATETLPEEKIAQKYREVRRLKQLQLLFSLGLRDIGDGVVLDETIRDFSYEEVERIVEARFEQTQLRDQILRMIAKALQHSS